MGDVIRVCQEVFGKAAILRITAELRFRAHRFPGRQAILAMTTRRVEPWHTDPVAFLHNRYSRSDGGDQPDGFVARNEWKRGLEWPIAMRGMEIGVANTAGLRLDQDLARLGRGYVKLPKHQRLSELLNNRGLHLVCHGSTPLSKVDE